MTKRVASGGESGQRTLFQRCGGFFETSLWFPVLVLCAFGSCWCFASADEPRRLVLNLRVPPVETRPMFCPTRKPDHLPNPPICHLARWHGCWWGKAWGLQQLYQLLWHEKIQQTASNKHPYWTVKKDGGKKTCWNSKNGLAESGSYLDVSCTIVMCSCSDGTWRFLNMALPQGELSFYQSWTTGIQNGVDTKGVHDRTTSWIHFSHLCLLESHCHEQEGGCIRGLFVQIVR